MIKLHVMAGVVGVLSLTFSSLPAKAATKVERLLPENAVFVAGIKNVEQTRERFGRTPLHEMLQAPEIKELMDAARENFADGLAEMMRELGIQEDEVNLPSGELIFAFYPVLDAELGHAIPAMLTAADFGDNAGGIANILTAALERGDREQVLRYEMKDLLGREVYEIDFSPTFGDEADDLDDDFGMMFPMMPDFTAMFSPFRQMYLVRDGDMFILCSDLGSLTESLDRLDGNLRGGLGEREAYRRILDRVGDDDGYVMLLTRDLMQLFIGLDQTGMANMVPPMMKSIFGDIEGIGFGNRFAGPNGMMENRMFISMPRGKGGLMRLMDLSQPREDLPRFVGPNAVSYSSTNIDFDRVVDVLRGIIQSNPLIQMQLGEGFREAEGIIGEVTATLGPKVYMIGTLDRPIELESMSTLVALDSRDPQTFENFFAQAAPAMEFEPRDFLGQRIYTMRDDMNMFQMMFGMATPSISVGLGGGYIFIGATTAVEQSLRTIAQPERLPSLDDDPAYRRAIASLPARPLVSWGYTDLIDWIEGTIIVGQRANEQMMEDLRRDFPEVAEEMERARDEVEFDPAKIDFEMLRRHIGPMVTYMESVEDGFMSVSYYLRPESD